MCLQSSSQLMDKCVLGRLAVAPAHFSVSLLGILWEVQRVEPGRMYGIARSLALATIPHIGGSPPLALQNPLATTPRVRTTAAVWSMFVNIRPVSAATTFISQTCSRETSRVCVRVCVRAHARTHALSEHKEITVCSMCERVHLRESLGKRA